MTLDVVLLLLRLYSEILIDINYGKRCLLPLRECIQDSSYIVARKVRCFECTVFQAPEMSIPLY